MLALSDVYEPSPGVRTPRSSSLLTASHAPDDVLGCFILPVISCRWNERRIIRDAYINRILIFKGPHFLFPTMCRDVLCWCRTNKFESPLGMVAALGTHKGQNRAQLFICRLCAGLVQLLSATRTASCVGRWVGQGVPRSRSHSASTPWMCLCAAQTSARHPVASPILQGSSRISLRIAFTCSRSSFFMR